MRKRAFTLIELLVVIAIIAILAAILFPVFAQAKVAAKKAACISNMKQWGLANQMYWADYDDQIALWEYHFVYNVLPPQNNRDTGNILYPYVKNMQMVVTPNSPISFRPRMYPDPSLGFGNPASMTGQQRTDQELYNAGWLSDYGLNYMPLTGAFAGSGVAYPYGVGFNPQKATSVANPGDTILLATSVWDRDASGGVIHGGNIAFDPPCRYYTDGTDTMAPRPYGATGAYWFGGWNPGSPLAWNVFGGVWPYYANKATVGFMDSHAKSLNIGAISAGCNVLNGWGGQVIDPSIYIWDRN
jgi:prepilin-type N-terminal cleavage/methylation domain-containing protein